MATTTTPADHPWLELYGMTDRYHDALWALADELDAVPLDRSPWQTP